MFMFEAIDDIGYFVISSYITYTIAAIVLPILFIRLICAFPYYVKHGTLGNDQNSIWTGDNRRTHRKMIRNFFVETHPAAVGGDLVGLGIFTLLLHMIWILVPFLIAGLLIWIGIIRLANYMRSQYLKKQKFHTALKGD